MEEFNGKIKTEKAAAAADSTQRNTQMTGEVVGCGLQATSDIRVKTNMQDPILVCIRAIGEKRRRKSNRTKCGGENGKCTVG